VPCLLISKAQLPQNTLYNYLAHSERPGLHPSI
jgi:hypothetical protein